MTSVLVSLLVACTAAEDTGGNEAPATFSRVQAELFTPSCAFSSCHGGPNGSAGLDLTEGASHAAIVGVSAQDPANGALVTPGDHAASYLWRKCAGDAGIAGDPMPNADGLDAERLQLLADWIEAGALDD